MGSKQDELRFIEEWVRDRLPGNSNLGRAPVHSLEPIAITGVSGYFPGCMDVASFWKCLDRDESLISEIPKDRFDWEDYYDPEGEAEGSMRTKWGGFIPDIASFDPKFFGILPLEAHEMDPRQRLLLMSTWRTLEDAGYDPDELKRSATGVFIGCEANEYAGLMRSRGVRSQALFNEADSLIANRISYHFDFAGPSEFVNTMCSSFAVALNRAVIALRSGEVDRAIVGAANLMLLPEPFIALSRGDQLSSRDTVRSFGGGADGYLRSEGVGTILIERLGEAEAGSRSVYAVVKHTAVNYNGREGVSMAAPNTATHCELIKSCYREAGIDPKKMTYVEAQGMGLPVADIAEWAALNRALAELCRERGVEPEPGFCRVSTLKPMAGHMHAASSLAALLKIIRSFQTDKVHKVLDYSEANEFCDMAGTPCRILSDTEPWPEEAHPRLAALHSYGSGGNNAHVLLEEYRNGRGGKRPAVASPVIVCLSARTETQLRLQIENLRDHLMAARDTDLADLSFTLLASRKGFDHRCAIVAESIEELIGDLGRVAFGEMRHPVFAGKIAGESAIDLAEQGIRIDPGELAGAWVRGASLANIEVLYAGRSVRRLTGLPGYPFEQKHCWFEDRRAAGQSSHAAVPEVQLPPPAPELPDCQTGDPLEDVRRRLSSVIEDALGVEPEEAALEKPFSELGLDSLSVPLFVARLGDEFGVNLRRSDVYSYPNIRRMAERIASVVGNAGRSGSGSRPKTRERAAPDGRTGDSADEIAIIGVSLRVAGARDHHEFWSNLKAGRCSIDDIPPGRRSSCVENLKTLKGGFIADVDKFDPLFFNIAPREAKAMDPKHRLLLESAYAAIEDSGYCPASWKGANNGIFVGIEESDYPLSENSTITSVHGGTAPARIGYFLDTKGPLLALGTACSSALVAIHYACQSLLSGESDCALAGGCNIASDPGKMLSDLAQMGDMLSPDGTCYAFDERANGMVIGEGVGMVVLKRLGDARRDHDAIYGVIKGTGLNYDGRTNGLTAPNGLRQRELYERVSRECGIDPSRLSYVVTHGTGTSLGDPVECNALIDAFEPVTDRKQFCALTSPKTNVGHTLAASGVVNLITAVLALKHRQIPPSLNFDQANSDIRFPDSAFYVNTSLTPWNQAERFAAVSSFGHSGTNAHLILGNVPESGAADSEGGTSEPVMFVLSAKTGERLREYARAVADYLKGHDSIDLARFCYTFQTGREAMKERLAVVCRESDALAESLVAYLAGTATDVRRGSVGKEAESAGIEDLVRAKNFEKLAECWVSGAVIAWEDVQPPRSRQRLLGLPTYPFSRESFWVESEGGSRENNEEPASAGRLHPLLHENTSDFSEYRFTSTFTGEEFFLADHVVAGRKLLPGVAYLELARAAVARFAGYSREGRAGIRLKNIVWARPIEVGPSPLSVEIVLRREEDGRVRFEIYTRRENGTKGEPAHSDRENRILHCQGAADFEALDEAPRLEVSPLRGKCGEREISPGECYEAFAKTGVDYGPALRGVEAIHAGNGQVLARLTLPGILEGTREQFVLHPCLMDSALQACIGLTSQPAPGENGNGAALIGKPLLPFALEEIEVRGECLAGMWAWIRPSGSGAPNEEIQKLDIDLCDEDGNVRVRLIGFSSRRLELRRADAGGTRNEHYLHPLIHERVTGHHEPQFLSRFTGTEMLFTDHLHVFPAAGYLEMARAAGETANSGDVVALKQIVWPDPMAVRDSVREVTTRLSPSSDQYGFEICAGADSEKKQVHCQGKIVVDRSGTGPGADPGFLEIENIRSRCRSELTAGECGELLQFTHGRSLMSIRNLRHDGDEAIAELRLPDPDSSGEAGYKLHPSILNGALLSSVILTLTRDQGVNLPIPFSLDELRIFGGTPEIAFAHVRKSPGGRGTGPGVSKQDIDLADSEGRIVVSFAGFTTVTSQGRPDEELVRAVPRWEEEALPGEGPSEIERAEPRFVLVEADPPLQAALENRWPGAQVDLFEPAGKDMAESVLENFLRVFSNVRDDIEARPSAPRVTVVLVPENGNAPVHGAISGLLKTARLESSRVSGKVIRYPSRDDGIPGFLIRSLEAELEVGGPEVEIRYDGDGRREVRRFHEIGPDPSEEAAAFAFEPGDVVWITGGLGKLGQIFAKHLGSRNGVKIVLSGRSALDETNAEILDDLRREAADVEYLQVDVSQRGEVASLVQGILERHGKLTGVIHCAGIVRDSYIHQKTPAEIRSVFAPKVGGILAIDEAVRDVDLSVLVLFSAAAGALGNPGQADYAGANAFLDAFAEFRNERVDRGECSGRTVSLNWPLWKEGGMRLDAQSEILMSQRTGMVALSTQYGIRAFDSVLSGPRHAQILVTAGNAEKIREKLLRPPRTQSVEEKSEDQMPADSGDDGSRGEFLAGAIQRKLIELVAEQQQIDSHRIDPESELSQYGFDSIGFTELANRLNAFYGLELMPTVFFENSNLSALAGYLAERYPERLIEKHPAPRASGGPDFDLAGTEGELGGSRFSGEPPKQETRPGILEENRDGLASRGSESIAIVGMNGRFPGARDLDEFWQHLEANRDLISEVPRDRWDWREYYGDPLEESGKTKVKSAGFLDDVDRFDPLFFGISPREAELMDPQLRLLMESVWAAVEDAGYRASRLSGSKTGVFVGVSSTDYKELWQKADLEAGIQEGAMIYHFMLANRVSYALNLHGPSESIDTACSSSLVAIHRAVESIRQGSCEMALVGGVNVIVNPYLVIATSKAGMLSEDGRCRTFDKSANGYGRGEGVGVILLKPLEKAISDGDQIHGIIRGTAENHGGKATSPTAPNPAAQQALLVEAYQAAGLDPRSISYIEAHGTGTELGDPIEIDALKGAFSSIYEKRGLTIDRNPNCGLGSVKTNIGHLEAAAGISGVLKVLLMMRHRKIPGNVHLTEQNPYIDLAGSPFYLVKDTENWEVRTGAEGSPWTRRAGVSSFGVGGANAHVVIEEFDPTGAGVRENYSSSGRSPAIIPLSAKNPERLREAAGNLLHFLRPKTGRPAAALEDIAFTLQTGREAMEERLVLVAESIEDLRARLEKFVEGDEDPAELSRGRVGRNPGNQELFAADEDMAPAIEAWFQKGKYRKLSELWVKGFPLDWEKLYAGPRPRRISLPTYPFARERYWVPAMESRAVPAPPGDGLLHPLLHRNTSDLSEQRFSSRFTGEEFFLADHIVKGRPVFPGVAYLEMARAAADRARVRDRSPGSDGEDNSGIRLENVVWSRPIVVGSHPVDVHIGLFPGDNDQLHYEVYSEPAPDGAGGDAPGADEEPVVIHSQGAVSFVAPEVPPPFDLAALKKECIQKRLTAESFYEAFAEMGLDYGPGHRGIKDVYVGSEQILAQLSLPAAVAGTDGQYVLHPSLMDSALQASVALDLGSRNLRLPFALESLSTHRPCPAESWAVIRSRDRKGTTRGIQKFDIDLCDGDGNVCIRMGGISSRILEGDVGSTASSPDFGTMMLIPRWREPEPAEDPAFPDGTERIAVLCDFEAGARENLEAKMSGVRLLEWRSTSDSIGDRFGAYATEAFEEIRTILRNKPRGKVFMQVVLSGGRDQGLLSALSGLFKTAQLENPAIAVQLIEAEPDPAGAELPDMLAANADSPEHGHVRYLNGKRRVIGWEEIADDSEPESLPWKDGGVYLITGGAGGLGLLFAEEIAGNSGEPVLVLAGRSALGLETQKRISAIETLGAQVHYRQADVSLEDEADSLIAGIEKEFGRLDGILHGAGVNRDNFILKKDSAEFREVLAPKVAGLVNLDRSSAELPLDFFVCFSSAAGALGNSGQADYAAGNAFMDGFMRDRSGRADSGDRHGRSLSINWPLWKNGGMGVDPETEELLEREMGLVPMETAMGFRAFYRALASGEAQVLVLEGNRRRLHAFVARKRSVAGDGLTRESDGVRQTTPGGEDLEDKALHYFKNLLSATLKLPRGQIHAEEPLESYGLDSIMVMRLTNRLEKSFGSLSKTLFFEYQTIREVRDHFLESHRETLDAILNGGESTGSSGEEAAPQPGKLEEPVKRKGKRRRFQLLSGAPAVPESRPSEFQDIAIIGLSGRYPRARDIHAYWENLRDGKDCITEVPGDRWDWRDYYSENGDRPGSHASKWGGFIEDVDKFDPLFFNISPREAELVDPQERLFLEQAWAAMEDAGYSRDSLRGEPGDELTSQVGVYAGVMYGEYQLLGAELSSQGHRIGFASTLASIANRVSYVLNLHGPSMTIDTMCSSSLTSIHLACQDLKLGRTSLAIAGGVNVTIHPNKYLILTSGNFLSRAGRCESFGEGGDGYIPSEGVGVVLLKRLDEAKRDGDHIYGVIKGSAINHGGRTNGYSVPNPNAQQMVVARALKEARVDPRAVSYVEAHGTGTKLGDPIEIAGLSKAFGTSAGERQYCWIGSAKSNIGHCESAAGIAGLSKVLLQMQHGQIVPSLHSETLNPNIAFEETPFVVNHDLKRWERPVLEGVTVPRIAGISSFGAGGSNAHLVVEEYDETPKPAAGVSLSVRSDRIFCIVLSARNEDRLSDVVARLHRYVRTRESIELADLAYTLQTGREAMEARLGFTAKSKEELERKLGAILADEDAEEDIYRGTVKRNREALEVIAADDDMARAVEAWIEKGKYAKLLDLWVKGLSVDWSGIYHEPKPRRLSLPTYPFARERYWVPGFGEDAAGEQGRDRTEIRYLQKSWELHPLEPSRTSERTVAILATEETGELAHSLSRKFGRSRIIELDAAESSLEQSGESWDEYEGFIDLAGCGRKAIGGLEYVVWLQQLIEKGRRDGLMLLGVTRGLESFRNPSVNLAGAPRAGLYRMLQSEYSGLRSRHLDVDPNSQPDQLAAEIAEEFLIDDAGCEVCRRNGERYRALLSEQADSESGGIDLVFPEDQVLWITGGTRGLGALCARHFASRYGVKRLVLTGREELPPRSSWPDHSSEESSLGEKIRSIQALEEMGVEVRVFALALNDEAAVREMVEEVGKTMGKAGGLIHCAGSGDPGNPAFIRKSPGSIEAVLSPKVEGLDVLRLSFQEEPLRFFVCFSSVSAIVPGLASGQSDYAMANAYMDYVAEAAVGECPLLSIQWPSWKETGMGEVTSRPYREAGFASLTDREGLEILDHILAQQLGPVVLPAVVDPARWNTERLMRAGRRESPVSTATPADPPPAPEISDAPPAMDGLVEATQNWLGRLLGEELKIDPDKLDAETPFPDYGIDSVLLAQLLSRINEKLAETLDPSILYEYSNLESLSRRLVRSEADSLSAFLNQPDETDAAPEDPHGNAAEVTPSAPAPLDGRSGARERTPMSPETHPLDIAVIGMSCRFAGADRLERYWDLLTEGRSAISPVPPGRWGGQSRFHAGLIDPMTHFDSEFFLLPEEDARAMDPQALVVLEESLRLISHAGYAAEDIKGTNTGVYLGARSRHHPDPSDLDRARNPIVTVGQNYFATNISQFFDLRGPSMVVDTACSSALVAMSLAIQSLERGDIGAALVGGVGLLTDDSAHRMFEKRQILSRETSFHVFDQRASGVVLGEGAGFVMLKPLGRALDDGDSIHAVIKGLAVNNDGRTAGPATPNIQAHKDVMRQALAQSGRDADGIRYIEANGSGSEVTDLLELKAIESVYRTSSQSACSLGSIKPNIGHPLCAEGIAGFIKLVLMVEKRQFVPFLSGQEKMKHYELDESPFSFCRELTPWNEGPRLAALNCFADGGTNAHVVLEGWDEPESRTVRRKPLPPPELKPIRIRGERAAAEPAGPGRNGESDQESNPWWGTQALDHDDSGVEPEPLAQT